MAEVDQNFTPLQYYNEAARSELQAHIEKVLARQGKTFEHWDYLWGYLEDAAQAYCRDLERFSHGSLPAPQETLQRIDERITAIDKLTSYLREWPPFDWFRNEGGFLVRSDSPKQWQHLTGELAKLRAKFSDDTQELQKFLNKGKTYAATASDWQVLFQWRVLEIGRQLLGPQVGRDDGPLMTFLQLALSPVLGKSTPRPPTLRSFARRNP
jgi:hypothetical protein